MTPTAVLFTQLDDMIERGCYGRAADAWAVQSGPKRPGALGLPGPETQNAPGLDSRGDPLGSLAVGAAGRFATFALREQSAIDDKSTPR